MVCHSMHRKVFCVKSPSHASASGNQFPICEPSASLTGAISEMQTSQKSVLPHSKVMRLEGPHLSLHKDPQKQANPERPSKSLGVLGDMLQHEGNRDVNELTGWLMQHHTGIGCFPILEATIGCFFQEQKRIL